MDTIYGPGLPGYLRSIGAIPTPAGDCSLRKVDGGIVITRWDRQDVPPDKDTVDKFVSPPPTEKIDHQAEVEEALTIAKSGPTVAKTLSLVERVVARVAELEKRL